jgi:hypothetical protein
VRASFYVGQMLPPCFCTDHSVSSHNFNKDRFLLQKAIFFGYILVFSENLDSRSPLYTQCYSGSFPGISCLHQGHEMHPESESVASNLQQTANDK